MTEATHDDGARRRTEALQAARQRDSHTKRAHVRSTIEKMLLAGDPVTFTDRSSDRPRIDMARICRWRARAHPGSDSTTGRPTC